MVANADRRTDAQMDGKPESLDCAMPKVDLGFSFSAHHLIMSFIYTKFHGNNFNGLKTKTDQTQFQSLNIIKGIIL